MRLSFRKSLATCVIASGAVVAPPALAQQAAPETSVSLPSGAGSRQGMGENFQADLSTGSATLALPFALVPPRGAIQVSLGLSYNSASGNGVVGQGWSIGVPFVARATDAGVPRYVDPAAGTSWLPEQDRFVYNGAPLVPICLVTATRGCTGALSGEIMPAWSAGWRYFRPKVDSEFQRIFWSPDGKTWRIQDKSGASLELGVPLDGSGDTNALETELANGQGRIFRWNVSRYYDAHGEGNPASDAAPRPYNVARYRYVTDGAVAYLSDIFDTPPAGQADAALDTYAHHTRLVWATRQDVSTSYRRGWQTRQALRLSRVDVTSKTFNGASAPRKLVRRYRLTYGTGLRISQLANVRIEGRCATDESTGLDEAADGSLAASNCPKLPPVSFEYGKVTRRDGTAPAAGPTGFGGIDDTLRTLAASPRDAVNGRTTDLLDVNSDGLPDVYHANAARFSGNHAVAVNAATGVVGGFGNPVKAVVTPFSSLDAEALSFDNANVAVFDPDGDGIVNFVHMPPFQRPAIFSPSQTGNTFEWTGRTTTTSTSLNPKIALANRDEQVRFADVNGDGLIDIVVNAGTSLETYLSLGRYPNGDGKFGKATWTGPNAVTLSADPLTACMPVSGSPVLFSDPTVRLVDVNGDGLVDILRARNAGVEYWPGRGHGVWGSGDVATCTAGTQGTGRHVRMSASPLGVEPTGNDVQLVDDVNADGLPDLVLVRSGSSSVWFNVDGLGWAPEARFNTPLEVPGSQLRLVDIDGSGTRDLLWANASDYRYIDLQGGKRPGLLTRVSNGLGQQTSIEYTTSVAEMLAARSAGVPWQTQVPTVVSVVKRVTLTDGLELLRGGGAGEITEYNYRDPIYDGRSHAFRGFRETSAAQLGDAHSATALTRVAFLTGECSEDGTVGRCVPQNAWMENPRDALRGLVRVMQIEDASGVVLSTRHSRYRLRNLYTGLDGSIVRHAFAVSETAFSYDVAAFDGAEETFSVSDVEVERSPGQVVQDPATNWTLPSTGGRLQSATGSVVDSFGNITELVDYGCSSCPKADETIRSIVIAQRPAADTSGWLFRPTETYVVGSSRPTEKRQRKFLDFDARGRMTRERYELFGTLALQRSHALGRTIAGAPPKASRDGIRLHSSWEYDAHGNVIKARGSTGQCESFQYATDYADLQTGQTAYVGTAGTDGCGTRALTSTEEYDRGLNLTRRTWGYNGELAQFDHDGLGRKVRVWSPDPARAGAIAAVASSIVEYTLPSNPATTPFLVIRTRTQDGPTPESNSYRDTWTYVDSRGRVIAELSQADPTAGDAGQWLVSGLADRSAKKVPWREYEPFFWTGSAAAFPVGMTPTARSTRNWADAFGRVIQSEGPDGVISARVVYHGSSVDTWDAADIAAGEQHGTFKTETKDGHGRLVSIVERAAVAGAVDAVETAYSYLSTGEVETIRRQRLGTSDPAVTRWFRYDSMGRLVLNVDPNTTGGFSANVATDPAALRAWRYAYDDENQLVGTSDARGCGVNTHYDAAGRIVAEDFSPCLGSHAAYTAPNVTTGAGTESFYTYDTASDALAVALPLASTGSFLGRMSSSSDRAAQSVMSYDGRGRLHGIARRVTKPGTPTSALTTRYAPRWYASYASFDGADRVVTTTTCAEVPELLAASGKSDVTTHYSKRGRVRKIESAYGVLIASIERNARGLSTSVQYGDAAGTKATFNFDARSRLESARTARTAPALWSSAAPPHTSAAQAGTTNQLVLAASRFEYDAVGNPIAIYDDRTAAEWPAGAKPVDRHLSYDGMSRVARVDYVYEAADDAWTSPYAHENATPAGVTKLARPSPHVSFGTRVVHESFAYDWLGNSIQSGDDQNGFFDRSLGTVVNGTPTQGPYQLKSASNRSTTGERRGDLSATYDEAGNMTSLVVKRDGVCLPVGASCKQRFAYEWDEIGRLATAKRWDLTATEANAGTAPTRKPDVELRHAYDHSDERVLKTAVDTAGAQLHTLYVFQTLEQRRTTWSGTEYQRDASTENVYLFSQDRRLARVVVQQDMPSMSGGKQHVLLLLPDQLGSSEIVIDRDTGELVERGTYFAYGNVESDYRPARWQGFRDDYRFTGKEEDIEVGLQYFGKRYYAAKLNRWISADPLAIHSAAADLNVYAYVHGRPFVSVDPNGECEIVCAMLIGAAVSMAIDAAMQAHANDWDLSKIDGWEVAFAGAAGALGGAAGAAVGAGLTQALAKPLGVFGAEFVSSVVGGMAGSVTSGLSFRAQMSARQGANGDISFEESLEQTFNPKALAMDVGLGAAGGLMSYGVNQILKSSSSSARSTKAPSQSNQGRRLTTQQIGDIGESAAADLAASQGLQGGPLQNKSNQGIDWIGKTKSGDIVAIEAKASITGRPPKLSGEQTNMNDFVRTRLERVASGRGGFSAADQARAKDLLKALDEGASLTGLVVETRYVGSGQQFTATRPWTSASPGRGRLLAPKAPDFTSASSGAQGAAAGFSSGAGADRAPILPLTCYARDESSARCDTTVMSW